MPKSKPKRSEPRTRDVVQPVKVTAVEPAAWETALQLADGDKRRLRVVDERTVLVRNA